jgi:uncharacterized protein
MIMTDISFVVDSTLGKLAKYLRLAGFDTLVDSGAPDARNLARMAAGQRIILTRSTRVKALLPPGEVIFIHDDRPVSQINQVFASLSFKKDRLKPWTRCSRCNRELEKLNKEETVGRIPDYVRQQQTVFKHCPDCKRVYWQGTHAERWKQHMQSWFDT